MLGNAAMFMQNDTTSKVKRKLIPKSVEKNGNGIPHSINLLQ
eukprot:gene12183-8384_t